MTDAGSARRRWRGTAVEVVCAAVRYSGAPFLVRHTVARHAVGIVVYHDPSPARLRAHLDHLGRRFTLIGMDELADAIAADDWSALPRRALIVTFDDGHRGNSRLAAIFAERGVRPLVYLCSGVVAGHGRFWFTVPGIDPEPLKLMTSSERAAAIELSAPSSESNGAARDALTPDEVRVLATDMDFGSHTSSHPILPLCDEAEAVAEIVQSRAEVESLVDKPCLHFSYPNGDFTDREVRLARAAGYVTARTTRAGWNRPGCDPHRLRIVSLADHASVNVLAAHLAGLFAFTRWRAARRRGRIAARMTRSGTP